MFNLLLHISCVVSLRISRSPELEDFVLEVEKAEEPLTNVRTLLASICGPSCASQAMDQSSSHIQLGNGLTSSPISRIGGQPLCKTDFVRESFTEEELHRTEEEVTQWLRNLDAKIEEYNNQFNIKNGSMAGRLNDSPHANQRFKVVLPAEGPHCKEDLVVFGETHDTQKPICDANKRLSKSENCNMISIGSNNKWDTEIGMYKQTKCHTHTFDCTSDDTSPTEIKDRTHFYKFCIGANDTTDSEGHEFMSWSSTLKAAKLGNSPEYLKMDIEGFEYGIMRNLIQSDSSELPNQIAMEIHHRTYSPLRIHNPASKLSWSDRNKDAGELLGFFLMMYSAGYRLTYIDYHTHCSHCQEVLWSKIYC